MGEVEALVEKLSHRRDPYHPVVRIRRVRRVRQTLTTGCSSNDMVPLFPTPDANPWLLTGNQRLVSGNP